MSLVSGNRAALRRAGLSGEELRRAAGEELYSEHLPLRSPARHRELVTATHDPSTWAMDFFQMGRKTTRKVREDEVDFQGFILFLQPLSCYVKAVRMRNKDSASMRRAFARARPDMEKRFGRIRTLTGDEDTAFQKDFQAHLDRRGITRKHEVRYMKSSKVERFGGLFKRHLAIVARRRGKKWFDAIGEAERTWNASYISKYGTGPPEKYNADNFGELVEAVYDKEPVEFHSFYPVQGSLTESEAGALFRYKPRDRVLVSMKAYSKRLQGEVRCLCFGGASEARDVADFCRWGRSTTRS